MAPRWLAGPLALAFVLSGCAICGSPPRQRAVESETTVARCAVGERPDYFVPGPADGPLALLGCARLGVSGKRVEFSGNLAHLDGGCHACINPAYSGRGQRGLYIPAICKLEPPLSRFAVRDAGQPRQGVRGYGYVIWGTAGAATHLVARFMGGTAQAAVMRVGPGLAARFGESPFSLFVVELPLSAACAAITVRDRDDRRTWWRQAATRSDCQDVSAGPWPTRRAPRPSRRPEQRRLPPRA